MTDEYKTTRKIINAIDMPFDPIVGQQIVLEGNWIWFVRIPSGKRWHMGDEVMIPTSLDLREGYSNTIINSTQHHEQGVGLCGFVRF